MLASQHVYYVEAWWCFSDAVDKLESQSAEVQEAILFGLSRNGTKTLAALKQLRDRCKLSLTDEERGDKGKELHEQRVAMRQEAATKLAEIRAERQAKAKAAKAAAQGDAAVDDHDDACDDGSDSDGGSDSDDDSDSDSDSDSEDADDDDDSAAAEEKVVEQAARELDYEGAQQQRAAPAADAALREPAKLPPVPQWVKQRLVRAVLGKTQKLHGVLRCKACGLCGGRDRLATYNQLSILLSLLIRGNRPAVLAFRAGDPREHDAVAPLPTQAADAAAAAADAAAPVVAGAVLAAADAAAAAAAAPAAAAAVAAKTGRGTKAPAASAKTGGKKAPAASFVERTAPAMVAPRVLTAASARARAADAAQAPSKAAPETKAPAKVPPKPPKPPPPPKARKVRKVLPKAPQRRPRETDGGEPVGKPTFWAHVLEQAQLAAGARAKRIARTSLLVADAAAHARLNPLKQRGARAPVTLAARRAAGAAASLERGEWRRKCKRERYKARKAARSRVPSAPQQPHGAAAPSTRAVVPLQPPILPVPRVRQVGLSASARKL